MSEVKSYRALSSNDAVDIRVDGNHIQIGNQQHIATFECAGATTYSLLFENRSYEIVIDNKQKKSYQICVDGTYHTITLKDERDLLLDHFGIQDTNGITEREIRAPMPGLVLDVLVSEGATIEEGAGLLILEAMKMENEIRAPSNGVISKIHVDKGDAISKNDLLIELR